ncbi:dihydrofolate reductase [Candidatus Woesearchaeota archaeon]|nr:dihydrofolate reductase [Candidatus Woesearchaeota archaeon]
MTEFIVIAAVSENNVIGKDGKMPWHIPEDLKRFKELTINNTIIMGHKTYKSLPVKPLKNRENIVLSRKKNLSYPGIIVLNSFEESIKYCKTNNRKKVFFIGGKKIYEYGLKIAHRLELTRVHKDYNGDTYFPVVNLTKWKLVKTIDHNNYSFLTYIRK